MNLLREQYSSMVHRLAEKENHKSVPSAISRAMFQTQNVSLTLCMLGNFSYFCCRLLTFFKINFFKKFFQENSQSFKRFGSRSGRRSVSPDLGPNCLQKLSAGDESHH